LAELRSAVQAQKLAVVSNILNIQETIDALHSKRPEVVIPQLELIADLVDWGRFVKPCDMLLTDDIRHFGWCGEASSPLLHESVVAVVCEALNNIIRGRLRMGRTRRCCAREQSAENSIRDRARKRPRADRFNGEADWRRSTNTGFSYGFSYCRTGFRLSDRCEGRTSGRV
jgi:hypothetical protein